MGYERDLELLRQIVSAVSQLALAVTNAIDKTAYDLNAAAFSETTAITDDYEFDSVEFNFSTAEEKTITITTAAGTKILEETTTDVDYIWKPDCTLAYNGGDNLTVEVTQFSSPGTMNCTLRTKSGSNMLLGSPDVRLVQSNGKVIEDNLVIGSNALPVIETDHARIHNNQGYICSDTITVPALSSLDFLLLNPLNNFPHMRLIEMISTQGNAEVIFFKGATVSDNGNACSSFNMNDNSSNTADLMIHTAPTLSDAGTQVEHDLITGGKQSGGSIQAVPVEFIMKSNGNRVVRYTNNANQDDKISFKFFWYES